MTEDCNHLEDTLRRGTCDEKIAALKGMRTQIMNGEPAHFFDLAKGHIGDCNREVRWQAIIVIGEYIPVGIRNEEIWNLVIQYSGVDDDMQQALATVLLEHLLEYDYDCTIKRIATAASDWNTTLRDVLERCWRFGQSDTQWRRVEQIIATWPRGNSSS